MLRTKTGYVELLVCIFLEIWIQISSIADSAYEAYYPLTNVLFEGDKKKEPR